MPDPDTVRTCLQAGTTRLQQAGVANPSLDAALLLAHALHQPRSWLYAYPEYRLSATERAHWQDYLGQRLTFRPLAYIVGYKEFRGLSFYVDERVLIPRPETELLVELALAWLDQRTEPTPRVVDVGTGSGCIALALAHARAHLELIAIDLSREALQVARSNRLRLRLSDRIMWRQGDLLAPVTAPVSLILANLPYVCPQTWDTLAPDITVHEPTLALWSAEGGLAHIRRLISMVPGRLQPGGGILLECGAGQAPQVVAALEATKLFAAVCVYPDGAGHERCVAGWTTHPEVNV